MNHTNEGYLAMSTFEAHCQESMRQFGQAFEAVHRWLDEFAGKPPYGMRHRRVRHHEAGIREAKALFGEVAGRRLTGFNLDFLYIRLRQCPSGQRHRQNALLISRFYAVLIRIFRQGQHPLE